MQLYLLQTFTNTLTDGVVTATSIADSWNEQWKDLLIESTENNINLYGALTNLGVFFAVGTLLFFMVQWLKDVIYSEYSRPISGLIWPFVVVVLLSPTGSGTFLANLTLGVRFVINTANYQVVSTADAGKNYQQAINMSVAEEVAGSLLRPCQSLSGDQQIKCFEKANYQITDLWVRYRNLYGNKPWIERLQTQVNQIQLVNGVVSEEEFYALLGSTGQTTIKNFLISLQYAFQNLLEATMLLIAFLGPVALGASLLPVAGKPIFAWLTGFLSAGIAKISFNIIAALTATVIIRVVDNQPQSINTNPDLMWFIIFVAILAPLLSLLLAAAGWFAVFSAISTTETLVRNRA